MKTNSIVTRVVAAITAVVVLSFSFIAYATNYNNIDFSYQPVTNNTTIIVRDYSNSYWNINFISYTGTVYIFCTWNGLDNYGPDYYICSNNNEFSYSYVRGSTPNFDTTYYGNDSTFDSTYGLYYKKYTAGGPGGYDGVTIPVFDSLESAFNEIYPLITPDNTQNFGFLPISSEPVSDGYALYIRNNDYVYYSGTNTNQAVAFFTTAGTTSIIYASQSNEYKIKYSFGGSNYVSPVLDNYINSDHGYYYAIATLSTFTPYNSHYNFNSRDSAFYALDNLFGYVPPTPTPGTNGTLTNVNLPAGNVAYIDISNISLWDGFTANAVMPENSSLIGPPWWNSNQRFGFSSSLPSQGMPVTGLTNIDWNKSSSGGIFGITRQASYSPVGPFQFSKYLVIYNPLYYGSTANGPYEWIDNPTISISVRANNVVVYPLLSSVGPGSSPGSSQVDTIVNGTPDDGTIDSANGEITWTKNGEISTGPQTGGANEPGAKNTINDWLENIATQISNFFSGAIGAVNTLLVAVRNFVDILKGLYIWLPGPVYNILQSAIMLAITIGVVKVFI